VTSSVIVFEAATWAVAPKRF